MLHEFSWRNISVVVGSTVLPQMLTETKSSVYWLKMLLIGGWDWGAFFWGQMTSFLLHTLIVQNHSFLVALSLHSIAFKEITILPWPSLKNYILYFRFSLKVLSNHLIHFAFSPKIFPHSSHWNLFLSIPRARSYSLPPPLVHTHPTFPKSLHPFSVYKDSQL